MYSPYDLTAWRARTQSLEYQAAYDITLSFIPKEGGIFVDLACGNGELLKRVCRTCNYESFLGIDASEEMLNHAQTMLEREGLNPHRKAKKLKNYQQGVFLMLDDIVGPECPPQIADTIAFTFPEILSSCSRFDARGIGRYLEENLEKKGLYQDLEILKRNLLRKKIASRFLRSGGTLVTADYDASHDPEEDDIFNKTLNLSEIVGLDTLEIKFFESPQIWEDAYQKKEGCEHLRKGYCVGVFRKR